MTNTEESAILDGKIRITYDTNCSFCQRTRRFVERRAGTQQYVFSHTDSNDTITVQTLTGETLFKYRACMYVLRRLHSPWRLFGYIGAVVPSCVGDWGYDIVARNRAYL